MAVWEELGMVWLGNDDDVFTRISTLLWDYTLSMHGTNCYATFLLLGGRWIVCWWSIGCDVMGCGLGRSGLLLRWICACSHDTRSVLRSLFSLIYRNTSGWAENKGCVSGMDGSWWGMWVGNWEGSLMNVVSRFREIDEMWLFPLTFLGLGLGGWLWWTYWRLKWTF
jgi:hypothetical protein